MSDVPDSPTAPAGDDGLARCPWAGTDALMRAYHDDEWGREVRDEAGLFERLCLEIFQAGLSWRTVLRKRDAFRAAFAGFSPDAVAAFTDADVARLMGDAGLIRNRRKIEAAITNARATVALRTDGGLDDLLWAHHDAAYAPATAGDVPSSTPASMTLAKELKCRGFAFVGPTNVFATMEATGIVNPHLVGCHRR